MRQGRVQLIFMEFQEKYNEIYLYKNNKLKTF